MEGIRFEEEIYPHLYNCWRCFGGKQEGNHRCLMGCFFFGGFLSYVNQCVFFFVILGDFKQEFGICPILK